jgi:hypothetical protein
MPFSLKKKIDKNKSSFRTIGPLSAGWGGVENGGLVNGLELYLGKRMEIFQANAKGYPQSAFSKSCGNEGCY